MTAQPSDINAHLGAIFSAANGAIFSIDLRDRIQCWNPAAEALFGFRADEAVGRDSAMIVPPTRVAEASADLERVGRGESFSTETARLHKSGRLLDVTFWLSPVRDDRGAVIGTCVIAHDISGRRATERALRQEVETRRNAEEALRASERDFRTFFEMVGVGNVIADARSGRFLRVNRHFCEITGYSEHELHMMNSEAITHGDDIARDRAGWEAALQERAGSFAIEKRYIRKDGRIVWVQVTSTLVRDRSAEPLHAIGVIRDVTDRRQISEELEKTRHDLEDRVKRRTRELTAAHALARQSAHRLETLIENSPLPIVTLDTEGHIQLWNSAAERLYGWIGKEVIGRPLPILPTKNRAHYEKEAHQLVTSRERVVLETQRQKRDGTLLDVAIWRAPLFNDQHELIGSVAILMDVTERKFLERALLESAERESRRIGQELHDHLCQHLLGAAFAAKALANNLDPGSPSATEAGELARLINSAVRQTRDIARGLNPVDLDSSGLMAALQELTQRPRSGPTCRLECEQAVLLPDAETALHAYRIAQEALTNAVRHSGAREIVVRLTEDERSVYLQIADDGAGFDRTPGKPRGLGLESMKYRAQVLGGRVWFDTPSGGGTSVTCALPKRK